MSNDVSSQSRGKEEVVYIMQEEKSNYSWVFWIIVIAILGFLAYYIISTIEDLKNPFNWFDIRYYLGGVRAWQ